MNEYEKMAWTVVPDRLKGATWDDLRKRVAQALQAAVEGEKERCAKVVEHYGDDGKEPIVSAFRVAAAIRKGE